MICPYSRRTPITAGVSQNSDFELQEEFRFAGLICRCQKLPEEFYSFALFNEKSELLLYVLSLFRSLFLTLFPQYTRNNLRHHGNHWGQWAWSTSPHHTLLPHGLAPGPITNPTTPGRRRPLNAQWLCCTQSEHDKRWHHHRALQRALRPLQVCVQRPPEESGSSRSERDRAGGERRRAGRREAGGGGRVHEWWRHPRKEWPGGWDQQRVGTREHVSLLWCTV